MKDWAEQAVHLYSEENEQNLHPDVLGRQVNNLACFVEIFIGPAQQPT